MKGLDAKDKKRIYTAVKRVFDVVLSILLLAFLWLPMLAIWLAVRLTSGGKGIFRQIRVGRNGKLFYCYKFRTMYSDAPPSCPASELENAKSYITPLGRFLRRSSLDELPQLFNVLKGDMSIVGPRPLIIAESEIHRRRRACGVYELRPGITGLSQVNGRNGISDDMKARLDRKYLEEFGLLQDVIILTKTVGRVITGDGVEKNRENT